MTTGPQGELADDGRTLVVRRRYPDAIDEVWSALTTSERLARWYGTYTGEGRPGGTVELTITGEVDAGGEVAAPVGVRIVECEAPRRLVVDIPENEHRSWRIALTLTEDAAGTALVLEQCLSDGLDAGDLSAGWSWYLDRLAAALRGQPMPVWEDYLPTDGG